MNLKQVYITHVNAAYVNILSFFVSVPFYAVAFYTYYNGIMDHSGVDFKAPWWQPWRPDTIFHDNHHQYFHVNFSFNIYYWDIVCILFSEHSQYRFINKNYLSLLSIFKF